MPIYLCKTLYLDNSDIIHPYVKRVVQTPYADFKHFTKVFKMTKSGHFNLENWTFKSEIVELCIRLYVA